MPVTGPKALPDRQSCYSPQAARANSARLALALNSFRRRFSRRRRLPRLASPASTYKVETNHPLVGPCSHGYPSLTPQRGAVIPVSGPCRSRHEPDRAPISWGGLCRAGRRWCRCRGPRRASPPLTWKITPIGCQPNRHILFCGMPSALTVDHPPPYADES
jgi:hypothetical protein